MNTEEKGGGQMSRFTIPENVAWARPGQTLREQLLTVDLSIPMGGRRTGQYRLK